jgi:hypothetical protein
VSPKCTHAPNSGHGHRAPEHLWLQRTQANLGGPSSPDLPLKRVSMMSEYGITPVTPGVRQRRQTCQASIMHAVDHDDARFGRAVEWYLDHLSAYRRQGYAPDLTDQEEILMGSAGTYIRIVPVPPPALLSFGPSFHAQAEADSLLPTRALQPR